MGRMTKRIRLALGAAGLLLAWPMALAVAADPAAGTWRTESNDLGQYLHVRIDPCGDKLCGVISAAFDGTGTQAPGYEHLNKRMIWNMGAKGDGRYRGGKIWAPDTGKTYGSKMALNGNRLTVSGCFGPICRAQTWSRVP